MSTGWSINALDLRQVGYNLEFTDGWDSMPEARSARNEHGFRHGERRGTRVFYRPRPLILALALLGVANSGDPPGLTREEYFQLHVDEIFGALHSPNAPIQVVRTIAGVGRTALCALDDAFTVTHRSPASRSMAIRLTMINPFWLGASFNQAVSTGDFNNLGNAPINDMNIVFGGAGSVQNAGDVVTATGACTVNLREDMVLQGGVPVNGLVTCTSPWILELQPGLNSLVVSGSVTLQGNYPYF